MWDEVQEIRGVRKFGNIRDRNNIYYTEPRTLSLSQTISSAFTLGVFAECKVHFIYELTWRMDLVETKGDIESADQNNHFWLESDISRPEGLE